MKRREIVFHRSDEYEAIECCDHCHGEPKECPDLKSLTSAERERWARNDYATEALDLVREFVTGRAELRDLKCFVRKIDPLAVVDL